MKRTILETWAIEYAQQKKRPRTVSAAAYWMMLAATNGGWVIGTLLYHWVR